MIDRQGQATTLKLGPGLYRSPRVSMDGKFVAFEREDNDGAERCVWVYELAGGRAAQRLAFGGNSGAPVWSRDGPWVVFTSDREGDLALFRQRADGSGTAERLTKPEAGAEHIPQSFSPGDTHLLVTVRTPKDGPSTLSTLAMTDRKMSPFGGVSGNDLVEGTFSPDGHWVAYSVADGRASTPRETFLQPFPATGAKFLVHGEHIIGVSSRGQVEADTNPQIVVVLNWFDDLRQRVPR